MWRFALQMVVEGQEPNWKPNGNPWSATEDDEGERGRKRLREAPQARCCRLP